jgi:hypothetical protein
MSEQAKSAMDELKDLPLEDILPKDVYTLIKSLVAVFAQQAWVYMGLHMNPLTGKVAKDLTQAKLAIDCAAVLVEKAAPFMEERERHEFTALIQNLQMNFIQQG